MGVRWSLVFVSLLACARDRDHDGFTEKQGDCNDLNITVRPAAPELCNGFDDDCNGAVDDDPTDGEDFYLDDDGDDFGDPDEEVEACDRPDGYVDNDEDCDDERASINPDEDEEDDNDLDDDCDGEIDLPDDTNDDSGWNPGWLLIDTFTYDCEPDSSSSFGSRWDYTITVSGENSGGLVILDQDVAAPWHEEHDLTGSGTTLRVMLDGADGPSDQQANQSTLFQCGMDVDMVWRYEVYDPSGVLADCVVASGSSTDPSSVWGSDFGGCANGNSW
jgi:hypothetical protein